jgi:acetyl-CoA carboxylase biotin carboxylase subunit
MFSRILIANRGEIAVRVIGTCRTLDIETVAVYSDADRRALHVLEADQAMYIGPAPASESYLNIDAIVRAARDSGAEAVHPGYGFLSENADFAQACLDAGLVFIGPSPDAIRMMGDKSAARQIAADHGVPTIPGYDGDGHAPPDLVKHAKKIGFPIMIKAAAGGGGRGMRLVDDPDRFDEAVESARREAERSFGDGRLILERAIVGGRHIEVQVLADNHGAATHLGERDCSVQRRHQKVIEESPSPAVDDALRERMGEAALKMVEAVDYSNAGTVEFMLDASGAFYFLEMNTRLQVEHGVTELVTGLDLVELQLRIASGEPLPLMQEQVTRNGHAIECRIYAEDPASGYLPSAGRLTAFEPPAGEGVRNDIGTYPGDDIGTHYDPMLAKLLTWGADRQEALDRMQSALSAYRIQGVKTNLSMLRSIVSDPVFRKGEATTAYLDSPDAGSEIPPEAILAAFGAVVLGTGVPDGNVWGAVGPWRPSGDRSFDLMYQSTAFTVMGRRTPGSPGRWQVRTNGDAYDVQLSLAPPDRVVVELDGRSAVCTAARHGSDVDISLDDRLITFSLAHKREQHSHAEGHRGKGLVAPMPGLVLRVHAREGDRVRTHQTLVVIEAMKMEHAIEAPHDGIVKKVHCAEGGRVTEGQLLVELEETVPE